jgi:predicted RNA-binding protein with PIN domain
LKTYIIDGYNLLWKLLPEKMELAELEGSRQELEGKLVEFISLVGEATVILVYDGKGGGSKLSRNRWGIRSCFTPRGVTADEQILDYAEEYSGTGEVYIVTSDLKDIARRLGGNRVSHIKSETFIKMLSKTLNKSSTENSSDCSEKPSSLKGDEIDEWLQEFDLKD